MASITEKQGQIIKHLMQYGLPLTQKNISHLKFPHSRTSLLPWWCRGALEKLFQYLSCLRKLIKVVKCRCRCTRHWWLCCRQWHREIRFRWSGKDALPAQPHIVQKVPSSNNNNKWGSVRYSPEGSRAVVDIQKGKPTDSGQRAAQDGTATRQVVGAHSVGGNLHTLLLADFQLCGGFLWCCLHHAQEKGSRHPSQMQTSQPILTTETRNFNCQALSFTKGTRDCKNAVIPTQTMEEQKKLINITVYILLTEKHWSSYHQT